MAGTVKTTENPREKADGQERKNASAEIPDSGASVNGAVKKAAGKPAKRKYNKSSAKTKASKNKTSKPYLRKQTDNDIFALDIGTRTVVGILGYIDREQNIYHVVSSVTIPHTQRSMIDGQIEDIKEVSRIVSLVKDELERKNKIRLNKVAIAAAGRALKTRRAELEFDISEKGPMTDETVRSFEVDTVLSAQSKLDEEVKNDSLIFYCVGHTVIEYALDGYRIKTLAGHKGKTAKVELIAAFLPNVVVESLYSVMDLCGLEVFSLTLEPIAAMNVIIPPEIRLINVALVDIGAGTSDIAVSQNGSIVAYAMSTTAGDEITEEIIRTYLVDFTTAEEIKLRASGDSFSYTDILGFEHEVAAVKFYESIYPALGSLAENIAENIIKANGKPPAAVFLVGGGSLISGIAGAVAEKLGIPENRVAVGGRQPVKHISIDDENASGPEYVTPVGIGLTATMNKGYDFSVVMLNGKKMRIFDTRTISLIDLLVMAGYKTTQIIGRSGRSLTFTLNGERQTLKGEIASPAEIRLNGNAASIDTAVKQGDIIEFTPANSGINAGVKISALAGDVSERFVTVDNVKYRFGVVANVNDKPADGNYQVQNFDNVTVSEISTLGDLMLVLPFDTNTVSFYIGGKVIGFDYYLKDGDDIFVGEKSTVKSSKAGLLAKSIAEREAAAKLAHEEARLNGKNEPKDGGITEKPPFTVIDNNVYFVPPELDNAIAGAANTADKKDSDGTSLKKSAETTQTGAGSPDGFYITLNGKKCVLKPNPDNNRHEFIELISLSGLDLENPPASGKMILTLNGKDAGFMSPLKTGDTAVIRWEEIL